MLRQGVVIGGDVPRIDAQAGIAVALGHVPEHLVVGLVLFENIEHVLKDRWLTRVRRHRHGQLAGQGRLLGLLDLADAAIFIYLGGVLAQGLGGGNRDAIGGAEERRTGIRSRRRLPVTAAQTLDVGRIDIIAVRH